MAIDINKVIIIGRLTRDPEIRTISTGTSVAKFSIAVNRKYSVNSEAREEVSYFNCVAWGRLVEVVRQYCQKGKQVAIEGRLRQNRWQDQQSGQNRSTVEIVTENLQLLGKGGEGGSDRDFERSSPDMGNSDTGSVEEASGDSHSSPPDMLDDDIPF